VPNVRAYVNSADEAHQVAARVYAETGPCQFLKARFCRCQELSGVV
jgi:hypothetical protein